ncbi:GNAT family N-acetyltransferase [Spirilliplanes yamanashiensis]|uniref:N-acetyltransferase n=1 Tax=Spirilliplanes yamanashiensis TaxID=42233 RepID=A0A8J3YCU4_9ACTN|nr:GNAT family N-acetyltransferase [Spirilliplanes yamanashiensis]MDP9818962.1 GNAT superfamily N-acetyltransferase [Spirilliplanes yamanashiensis]GIJ05417.1 N-acetyltransferase [Spirilliplanes yamanashiensis]
MNTPAVLRPGEHRAAAGVLIASHADYPAFRHVFPDRVRRRAALRPFFEATIRDAIGYGGAYADDPVTPGAVGVWLPPGAYPWSAARKVRALPALARTFAAAPRCFPAFAAIGGNGARAHPAEPHWYLVVLGVRPERHGRGLGSRIVQAGLDRADRDGVPAYLETSDPANVPFYRRFGFEVTDPDLRLVPGGPPHIALRRPAHRLR